MKTLRIVKVGGKVIDDPSQLKQALELFAGIPGPKILVHGGGAVASAFSAQMGIRPKLMDGRRITDAQSLQVVQMVYAGLINKNIVAKLQSLQCQAMGVSGADGNFILAQKRPEKPIDYGYVGDVIRVNTNGLTHLLNSGFCPVFCSLTHDGKGQILNTNADTIAAELASAPYEQYRTELYFCFEKKGVLQDVDDNDSVIPLITPEKYKLLKADKSINSGMLPKLDNAFRALKKGAGSVYISSIDALQSLGKTDNIQGTRITLG